MRGVGGLRVLPEEGLQRKVPEGGTPFSGYLRKDSPERAVRTGVAPRKRLLKEHEENV